MTNTVLGTQTVVRAATQFGVERFVLISTDKAVNPASIMGATKRIAELLVSGAACRTGRRAQKRGPEWPNHLMRRVGSNRTSNYLLARSRRCVVAVVVCEGAYMIRIGSYTTLQLFLSGI